MPVSRNRLDGSFPGADSVESINQQGRGSEQPETTISEDTERECQISSRIRPQPRDNNQSREGDYERGFHYHTRKDLSGQLHGFQIAKSGANSREPAAKISFPPENLGLLDGRQTLAKALEFLSVRVVQQPAPAYVALLGHPQQENGYAGRDGCRTAREWRELGHQHGQNSECDERLRNQGGGGLQHHPTHLVRGGTHIIEDLRGIAPQMQAVWHQQVSLQQAG